MYKKIFKLFIVMTSALLFAMCTKTDSVPYALNTKIDVSKSSVTADKLSVEVHFSTDGTAFSSTPIVHPGQSVQAKIWDPNLNGGSYLTSANCYSLDWSGSTPTITDANGVGTFTFGSANSIKVSIVDTPFDADKAVGTYKVVKDDWVDFHPGDILTVQKIDATHIRVVEYPATSVNHAPMVITITDVATGTATVESQDSGAYTSPAADEETTSGTGTVSSCKGTIDLTLTFKFPDGSSYTKNVLSLTKN